MHWCIKRGFISSRIWRNRDFSARWRFTQVLLTESERATPVSYSGFSDIFRVNLTVSKLFDILFWLVIATSNPFQNSNLAWVISLGNSPALPKLIRVRQAVEAPRGANICGSCDFFNSFFIFFSRATAHFEPIFAHNSSEDAFWCKEDLFWHEKCVVAKFAGVLPQNTPKMG